MDLTFYIAVIVGAIGVYFTLPHDRSKGTTGGLVAAAILGLILIFSLAAVPDVDGEGNLLTRIHMGLFTFIAAAAALRVITHTRPVYSALYFVLVVLSSAGMLVLLEAEFMAFAMVIIYGGAILITYMFVIMLATLPQSDDARDTGPVYDRFAREPGLAVIMGFALIAVVCDVIGHANHVNSDGAIDRQIPQAHADARDLTATIRQLQRKLRIDRPGQNIERVSQLERIMREHDLITVSQHVFSIDFDHVPDVVPAAAGEAPVVKPVPVVRAVVRESEGQAPTYVTLDDEILNEFVANIDQVGLNLFEGHTLGIELAGVILLLSMVGAIVIARQKTPDEGPPGPQALAPEPADADEQPA